MPKYPRTLLARAKKIKLLLMDVDGVLTDGKFYYLPRPDGGMLETKGFDSRDGLGLRLVHSAGLKTGIITGRASLAVECRVKDMGINFLEQNALEKIEPYEKIRNAAQVEDAEVCYVGNDLTDLPLLTRVGLGVCVANGDPFVRQHAHFTTRRAGRQRSRAGSHRVDSDRPGKVAGRSGILSARRSRHKACRLESVFLLGRRLRGH